MMQPISLIPGDQPLSREWLEAPGGFLWWYADIWSPDGDGLVLIWSFGLPFLPGYQGAARRGQPVSPRSRPSLNIALYRRGQEVFYTLAELPASSWTPPRTWVFGDSRLETELTDDGRCLLTAELDCSVAGTADRLAGTITIDGPRVEWARDGDEADKGDERPHVWGPLVGPAEGHAQLTLGGKPFFELRGRAYHDRNGSCRSFDELGIEHWIWGRVSFTDRERIFFLLYPEPGRLGAMHGVEIDATGRARRVPLTAKLLGPARARYQMPMWERIELTHGGAPWLTLRSQHLVEDGPFYLRAHIEGTDEDGERAQGGMELIRPARVDRAWMRPFIRMRIQHPRGNSPWLPLFEGPHQGRLRRLANWLTRVSMRSTGWQYTEPSG